MDRIGIAILSYAHGHATAYSEEIVTFPDARLVAIWDDNLERGERQAKRFGAEFQRDIDRVLGRADVDAVFVTCPTNRHADLVELACQAGKAVFLQKPMALTLDDCDRILRAVERAGVRFSMCHQMRADPINRKIKQLLSEGAVGKVAVVRRRHSIGVLLNPAFTQNPDLRWHIDPVQNMGMFMDDASHATDWFHWMLGRPTSVVAEIDNVVTNVAPDDNGVAVYRFQNKEIGILLNSSTTLAAEATTEIYGDQGTIVQNYGDSPSSTLPRPPGAVALKIYRAGAKDWEPFDFPADVPHGSRIRAVPRPLVDYVKGDATPLATAEDGRVAVEMVLGAYQSAREGRRVRFPL